MRAGALPCPCSLRKRSGRPRRGSRLPWGFRGYRVETVPPVPGLSSAFMSVSDESGAVPASVETDDRVGVPSFCGRGASHWRVFTGSPPCGPRRKPLSSCAAAACLPVACGGCWPPCSQGTLVCDFLGVSLGFWLYRMSQEALPPPQLFWKSLRRTGVGY